MFPNKSGICLLIKIYFSLKIANLTINLEKLERFLDKLKSFQNDFLRFSEEYFHHGCRIYFFCGEYSSLWNGNLIIMPYSHITSDINRRDDKHMLQTSNSGTCDVESREVGGAKSLCESYEPRVISEESLTRSCCCRLSMLQLFYIPPCILSRLDCKPAKPSLSTLYMSFVFRVKFKNCSSQ